MTWRRAIALAFAWQIAVTPWMMWDFWDSPTKQTYVLRSLTFLIVPLLAGCVHRSWRAAVATFLMPILSVGVMMAIFMIRMGNGR